MEAKQEFEAGEVLFDDSEWGERRDCEDRADVAETQRLESSQ